MDRNFARALALVLKSEGGWSDNPADPGGATMKGVTLANFRRYVKADASKADLKKIGDDQVATVYRRFYWDAVLGAELPDGVDYAVFDFAVNSGPGRAVKYLQATVGVSQDDCVAAKLVAAAKAKPKRRHRPALRCAAGVSQAIADMGNIRARLVRSRQVGASPGLADVGPGARARAACKTSAWTGPPAVRT